VGILTHPERVDTLPVGQHIAATLLARGIPHWLATLHDEAQIAALLPDSSLLIAIGGDGMMLRTARLGAPGGVPVLGLNMGRLGFLTEIATPAAWEAHLERLLRQDYWLEERLMIAVCINCGSATRASGDALNDVVISGDRFGRMIQLETYIDGAWTTTYNSDALIIATPTGSTAYALAVGGPVLPPEAQNILLVPAAAHLSMDRPIVLPEGAQVEVRLAPANRHPVVLTVDGVALTLLERDDVLRVTASRHISRFLRMRDRHYFYRSLLDRLEPRVSRGAEALDRPVQGGTS
jgi:NAD+ kinase